MSELLPTTPEHHRLRNAGRQIVDRYGLPYSGVRPLRTRNPPSFTRSWRPRASSACTAEEYGGGGDGLPRLHSRWRRSPLPGAVLMWDAQAICGDHRRDTARTANKAEWLPGLADGTKTMAFAITEPDAVPNHPTGRSRQRDGEDYLSRHKVWTEGADQADATNPGGLPGTRHAGRQAHADCRGSWCGEAPRPVDSNPHSGRDGPAETQ